jgi:hypothetical protein
MNTVSGQEVGHLSSGTAFRELKQQIVWFYGLVWWTSIL